MTDTPTNSPGGLIALVQEQLGLYEQLEALRGGSKKKDKKADYSWASIHKFREQL